MALANQEIALAIAKASEIAINLSTPVIVLELGLSVPIVQNIVGGDGSSSGVSFDFTDSNLSVAGIYVVSHGLNIIPSSVIVYDAVGETIYPDRTESLTPTMAAINLESFRPLSGTWKVIFNG